MLRLKEIREQRHLTQGGLGIKLSISQSTISAYETGDRTPDLDTLVTMANFFGVSLDYLAGLSDKKLRIDQSDLSDDEMEHLQTYRQLSDINKAKVQAYISGLKDQ